MKRVWIIALAPLWLGATCAQRDLPTVPVDLSVLPEVSYVEDVAPILDQRCVVCHSCYNAPCQLKLSSFEGVDRGGSQAAVYDSSRLTTQDPTRLFIDAQSTTQWRAKGFHSVTESPAANDSQASLMFDLLDAKRRMPTSSGEYHSEADDLTCAADTDEMAKFLTKHPMRGMPFGFPALDDSEFTTLAAWLNRGARGPSAAEQHVLEAPSAPAQAAITKWETFLNRSDAKHAMTARYLYDHYFLAHLHFEGTGDREFYQLVRSTTPSGEPIQIIATVRPYDDPGVASFYYRFQKIHSTIVYKTHMVVEFGDETLARFRELFITPEWLEEPHWVALDTETGANPFLIYAQIPPESRYRFLLDNAEYVLRTFIRGPVCKGQVALNVIHDHFWVMFLDPDSDQTVLHPDFLVEQAASLRLPTEEGSDDRLLQTFSNRYRDRYKRFYQAKSTLYDETNPDGLGIEAIWKGERPVDAPVLTIYRHFDSASVHKGTLGDLPRTLWVIDYSQFERIYYALVAGFDVFGNLSHQVNVRRYMDYLRVEGELNFIDFLPANARMETLKSWYLDDRAVEHVDAKTVRFERGTKIPYRTANPKREFVELVVDNHILPSTDIAFDPIGYHRDGRETPMPASFETHENILDGFRALTAPGTGFIREVTSSEANLIYVRIRNHQGTDRLFTIVINRWHDNVHSMFDESSRLDPARDTINFVPGTVGSYPNYFFVVEATDLPDFFDLLENFDGSESYRSKIRKYGVNRANADFWAHYDWFQARSDDADPLHAGVYDLNRYYSLALEAERTSTTGAP